MSPICRCGQAEQAVWSGSEGQCGRQRAVRRAVATRYYGYQLQRSSCSLEHTRCHDTCGRLYPHSRSQTLS